MFFTKQKDATIMYKIDEPSNKQIDSDKPFSSLSDESYQK